MFVAYCQNIKVDRETRKQPTYSFSSVCLIQKNMQASLSVILSPWILTLLATIVPIDYMVNI